MKPRELAHAINTAPTPRDPEAVATVALGTLLTRSQSVWELLRDGQFEADDSGYVTFGVKDHSNIDGTAKFDSDNVDGIDVEFVDPTGQTTKLGEVNRLPGSTQLGYAQVSSLTPGQPDGLLSPSDEAWDVIVATLERAILECGAAGS